MITTATSPFVLEQGADQAYNGSSISIEPIYYPLQQKWRVSLRILSSTTTEEIARYTMLFDKSQIDAFTGTGTGDTAKINNALEQAVVDSLEAIADNATVVFTIV